MKNLSNFLSLLLILVIGSTSILSGQYGQENKLLSFEQDIINNTQVDGDFDFFVETATDKITVPSLKINGSGDYGIGFRSIEYLNVLESGLLHWHWFKNKCRFFEIENLLFPFHFFL